MIDRPILVRLEARVARGDSVDEVAAWLRGQKVSPSEAIKMIRESFRVPLADAKLVVTTHPSWKDVVVRSEALHDAAVKALAATERTPRGK